MHVPELQTPVPALVAIIRLLGARHEVEEVTPPLPNASRDMRGHRLGRGLDLLQARRRGAQSRHGHDVEQRHELSAREDLVGGRERRRHDVDQLELIVVVLSRRRSWGGG